MKGGFDLYGKYYPDINDALNAEMSQCNEIDNRHNRKKIEDLERKLHEQQRSSSEEEFRDLWEKIEYLETRIAKLENPDRICP